MSPPADTFIESSAGAASRSQREAGQGLIQAAERMEAVTESGEHEHSPYRRIGANQGELAAAGGRVAQTLNKHPQHRRVQEAHTPEVDDQLWFIGIDRITQRRLDLCGVRSVERSVQHEDLCEVAGWLGATAALIGHRPSLRLALCVGSGEAMKRLT